MISELAMAIAISSLGLALSAFWKRALHIFMYINQAGERWSKMAPLVQRCVLWSITIIIIISHFSYIFWYLNNMLHNIYIWWGLIIKHGYTTMAKHLWFTQHDFFWKLTDILEQQGSQYRAFHICWLSISSFLEANGHILPYISGWTRMALNTRHTQAGEVC